MPVLHAHDVTFHASHPVLADFATDLVRTLAGPVGHPVAVQVGAHRRDALLPQGAVRLGIQTEQMRDEGGAPLWKAFPPQRMAEMMARFDAVLDLSAANAPAYGALPPEMRARVHFGPHIFPEVPPPHSPGGAGLLFIGALNDRRRAGLAVLQARHAVTVAPDGTFGSALAPLVAASAGLLNLHFHPGTYTEAPRLLKAVLAGKVLVSDPLAAPLIAGADYLGIDDWTGRPADAARVCTHAARHLTTHFAFRRFLVGSLLAHGTPPTEGASA